MDIIYARKETVIVFNTVYRMMKTILLYIFLMRKSNEQEKKDSSVYHRSVLKMFKILFWVLLPSSDKDILGDDINS